MEIKAKIINFSFDSYFKSPLLYKAANCDVVAQKCLEAFSSYGLRPTQILVRRGDDAFNFDLTFSLFNGNATFKFSTETVAIRFQNAANATDLEIVIDCVARFYEHIPWPEISFTSISVDAQTAAASNEAKEQYLIKYGDPTHGISQGGVIAYASDFIDWREEIRFEIDRSIMFSDGLFLVWTTKIGGNRVTRELLRMLHRGCTELAGRFDLVISQGHLP